MTIGFTGRYSELLARGQHRARWLRQLLQPPDVAIIGGYHCGNLGDMALGRAVQDSVQRHGYTAGLHTIYNLHRWPRTAKAIVGGGAVGYAEPLQQLVRRFGNHPQDIGLLGVDFNDSKAVERAATFLRDVRFISCRSEDQASALRCQLDRADVISHPDIAFSFKAETCKRLRLSDRSNRRNLLGINLVPLYASQSDDTWVPAESLRRERPRLLREFDELHRRYVSFVRTVCSEHIAMGFEVVHIPFTPSDDHYARQRLSDLGVRFYAYKTSPDSAIERVSELTRFLTTRFHALVFAAKLGIEAIPFAYARKNERLLETLGYESSSALGPDLLLDLPTEDIHWSNYITRFPEIRVSNVVSTTQGAIDSLSPSVLKG